MSSIELGAVIVDALHAMGAHFVLAPGSRNAPLSLRVDQLARDHGASLHVVIDERAAAFTALGLTKSTGRLAVVMVTSGSAVANLAPAVLEAKHAGVPMLVVSADRPMEAVGSGASQTADQIGIFGPSVLGVTRLSSKSGDVDSWRAAVERAAHLALGTRTREPGPVQINAEFTPPLVGKLAYKERRPTIVAASRPAAPTRIAGRRKTVIVAGDMTPDEGLRAQKLAETAGAPLLAEPSSNARFGANAIATYRGLLATPIADEIERVIVFGHPTLSRPQNRLLSREDVELVVVSPRATWHDIGHRASIVADDIELEPQEQAWLDRWRDRDQIREPEWGGRAVAAEVLASLSQHDALVLGASNIIRDADLAPIHSERVPVYASRGQAGIDGTIATARGIALGTGRPTTVVLGDITAQHDLGSLVRPPLELRAKLRIVVADDDGGALFHKLEQGAPEYAEAFERVFATPQSANLAGVAKALGWRVAIVHDQPALRGALASDAEFIVAKYPR